MAHRRQVRLPIVAAPVASWGQRGLLLAVLLAVLLVGCASEIPHPAASRTDACCRQHHTGRAGAPASHDQSGCVSCHEVGDTGAYPATMPLVGDRDEQHPRHEQDVSDPIERALQGVSLAAPSDPIEALRIVHSFDPCLQSAVH